jgi:cell division septum initiation protein DivIVA
MASDITGSVQAMEAEAAQVIEEAKAKAGDILQKARDEARKMSSEQLPLDDVKAECAKIVKDAELKASTEMKEAEKRAADIAASAAGKTDKYVKSMVNTVLGEQTA